MSWGKTVTAVCAGVLLVWLAADAIFGFQKTSRIERALQSGEFEALSHDQEADLRSDIGIWLKNAGVSIPFAINEPPKRGRLNVYITSPEAFHVTGVGFGNARYDPSIDAIFIDRFFLNPNPYLSLCEAAGESSVTGCRGAMPSQRVMFAFIFLHELGHRQKHGIGSAAFGSRRGDPTLLRLEAEADAYSIAQIRSLYTSGHEVAHDREHMLSETLGFTADDGNPTNGANDQMWVDLLGSLIIQTTLNSFLPAPYSPFYHDLSHPSLYERTAGLYTVALADPSIPDPTKVQFRFFQEILRRQELIPEVPFTEIIVPEAVSDVAFDEGRLVLRGGATGSLYGIPDAELSPANPDDTPKVIGANRLLTAPANTSGSPDDANKPLDVFWAVPHVGLIMADGSRTWRLQGNRIEPFSFPVSTNNCFALWTAPGPTASGLVATCDEKFNTWLSAIDGRRVIATRSVEEIVAELRAKTGGDKVTLELLKSGDRIPSVVVNGKSGLIPITIEVNGKSQWSGIVELNLTDLSVSLFRKARLPVPMATEEPARALFPASGRTGAPDSYLVGGGGGLAELSWGVWRVSDQTPPALVVQRPFLIARDGHAISVTTLSDFDPFLVEARDVGNGHAVINFNGDGVFLVDFDRQTIQLLYGYGGTPFQVVSGANGRVALYVRGGGKVYVFSPK